MTLSPGFKEIHARGLLLDYAYRHGPLAQWHELTVTAPMLVELDAAVDIDKNYNYRGGIVLNVKRDGEFMYQIPPDEINSQAHSVLPLQTGKYRILITSDWDRDQNNWPPLPFSLSVREITKIKIHQHITIDQRFTQTAFEGAWLAGGLMEKNTIFKGCAIRQWPKENRWLDVSAPHKLVVTTPKMLNVAINKESSLSPVLHRTTGETRVFCGDAAQHNLNAFLVPGEYELYVVSHKKYEAPNPTLYEVRIGTQN